MSASPGSAYEVIVAGLGAMGAAAVYQLAARGVRVLGLDRFSPPHTLGSSHGDTRITRLAIGEGMAYVPLALRSHQLWREIEAVTGATLMTTTGGLVLGRLGSGGGFHHRADFLSQTIAAAQTFGVAHELLDAEAVGERFPQFRLADGERAYFEPSAGFLRPEACVAAQLELAAHSGAEIRRDEPLQDYRVEHGGVIVTTSGGRYSAGALVLSVGAWLPGLLHPPLRRHFAVYRQVLHWFATTADGAGRMAPDQCPVYIWDTGDGPSFYGFPAVDGAGGGVKVATEQFLSTTAPEVVDRSVDDDESLAFYDATLVERMPLLRRQRLRAVTCLYTTTPDGDFVIDWHPDSERVLLVSPCSGHGFKHSAAIGEAVAELVTTGASTVDLSAFAFDRLSR